MTVLFRSALLFGAAAMAGVGFASPSFARSTESVTLSDGGVLTYDAGTGDYCISDTVTGSRIAHVTCKSQAGWKADGLTITRR